MKKNEVWTVALSDISNAVYTVSNPVGSTTHDTIGASLRSAIDGATYRATYDNATNTLTIIRLSTSAVTASATVDLPKSSPMTMSAGTMHEPWTQTIGSLDGFLTGDVFTLVVTPDGGTTSTLSYTVVDNDTSDTILSALNTQLPAGYTSSVSSGVLTISRSDRAAVTASVSHVSAAMSFTKTDDSRTHYNALTVDLTGEPKPKKGKVYRLFIDDRVYSYTAKRTDTISTVATELTTLIAADASTYGWTATNSVAGKIALSGLNGKLVSMQEGNGSLQGLIDIDKFVDAITGNARPESLNVALLDPSGNAVTLTDVVVKDANNNTIPDAGSLTVNDALKSFTISQAGTYKIVVYTGATLTSGGVPAGSLYRLNLSLVGRSVSSTQVSLAGKTITFDYQVSATGGGTEAFTSTITDYDPETNTYTLADSVPASMPNGTKYTIAFDIDEVYPAYAGDPYKSQRADEYQIVLTQAPANGEIVRVSLADLQTRTYNSQFAFTDGGGEHNDAQTVAIAKATGNSYIEFDSTNWNVPQTVLVNAKNDNYADGQDASVFISMDQRVNRIRGPVIIDGGNRLGAEQFLNNPVMLPGENNFPLEDGSVTANVTGPLAGFTDSAVTHYNPTTKTREDGFDPRMNNNPYSITFLNGRLKGYTFDVDHISGDNVYFKQPWPLDANGQPIVPETTGAVADNPDTTDVDESVPGAKYFITPVNLNLRVVEEQQVDTLNLVDALSPVDDALTITDRSITGLEWARILSSAERPLPEASHTVALSAEREARNWLAYGQY